jgi:hypothetical protein
MKFPASLRKVLAMLAAGAMSVAVPLSAQPGHDHPAPQGPAVALVPVNDKTDAAWLAKARAAYALDHCPVCDDKLEDKSPDYIYRQSGQPDRLVRLCGDMECVPNFLKDPAKYLKMIDDAAAAKAAAARK